MAHTFTSLLAHIVFSTRNRKPQIDVELKPRLLAYMGATIREMNGSALIADGAADHVHLLISLPPAVPITEALRVIKTNSSRWVHDNWSSRRDFGWQTGYGAFSVSRSNVPALIDYIARQEEHHRTITFQQELIACLKKHGIEYDERYIWD